MTDNDDSDENPLSDASVGQVLDAMQDLWDRGLFVSARTWDLIAELVRRIPNSGAVTAAGDPFSVELSADLQSIVEDVLRPGLFAQRAGVTTRVVVRAMYERRLPLILLPDGTLGIPATALDQFAP